MGARADSHFAAVVIAQLIHVYNVRAQGTSVWWEGLGDNRVLHWSVAASAALQVVVVYLPVGNALFGTVRLDLIDCAVILAASIVAFLVVDAIKRWVIIRNPDWVTAKD